MIKTLGEWTRQIVHRVNMVVAAAVAVAAGVDWHEQESSGGDGDKEEQLDEWHSHCTSHEEE
jgi:hypothetical protein